MLKQEDSSYHYDKTGMTLALLVTTKKFAINFKQQKTDLNAERKKTSLLEQQLQEMEAALAAGIVPIPPSPSNLFFLTTNKTVSMAAPTTTQDARLAKKFNSQLNLPHTPGTNPANASSVTKDEVGRWD